jgi:RNA polymerase primary sigma factor
MMKETEKIEYREPRTLWTPGDPRESLVRPEREAWRDARAEEAKKGNVRSLHKLIEDLEPMVGAMARRRRGQGVPHEDLMQAGWIAFLKAVERYAPGRAHFSTYATWWIRHAMDREIADRGRAIRVPVYRRAVHNRERKARERVAQRLRRPPTDIEVAREMGVKEWEVMRIQTETAPIASIDKMMDPADPDNPRPTAAEMFYLSSQKHDHTGEPEKLVLQRVMREALADEVRRAAQPLELEDLYILYLRYWRHRTRKDIEKATGLTPSAVRHRENRAKKVLWKDKKLRNSWIDFQN